jgi:hypothetical protein
MGLVVLVILVRDELTLKLKGRFVSDGLRHAESLPERDLRNGLFLVLSLPIAIGSAKCQT